MGGGVGVEGKENQFYAIPNITGIENRTELMTWQQIPAVEKGCILSTVSGMDGLRVCKIYETVTYNVENGSCIEGRGLDDRKPPCSVYQLGLPIHTPTPLPAGPSPCPSAELLASIVD